MKKRSLRAPFFFAWFFRDTELDSSLASQAPTGFCGVFEITDVHCGSWLASDGGITVGASLEFDLTIQVQNWAKTSRIYILCTI
ncbi:hypothetical protein [Pseudomonas sp. IT-232MI5]|uniref:hypothetical protein n=1 Tax=Pseudomonas sp. IT-232MI5 TaxID=3026442 RepID=UPI0039E033B4